MGEWADLDLGVAQAEGANRTFGGPLRFGLQLLPRLDDAWDRLPVAGRHVMVGSILPAGLVFQNGNYRMGPYSEMIDLLGITVPPKDWNERAGEVRKTHPNRHKLNAFLSGPVDRGKEIALDMATASGSPGPRRIKAELEAGLKRKKRADVLEDRPQDFLAYDVKLADLNIRFKREIKQDPSKETLERFSVGSKGVPSLLEVAPRILRPNRLDRYGDRLSKGLLRTSRPPAQQALDLRPGHLGRIELRA